MARRKTRDSRPWAWLDEYKGKDFNGEWPTLTELFSISCKKWPDNKLWIAYSPKELVMTRKEAFEKVQNVASYLIKQGVKKGEKIAVCGKNSPEWGVAFFGILFSGATVVPIDYALHENEMDTLMKFGGVSRIFIDSEKINEIDKNNSVGLVERISLEEGDKKYQYVLELKGDNEVKDPSWSGEEVAAMLFTSGTTGVPKAVQLTNNNIVSDTFIAQCYMPLYPDDVFYAILPIHHAYTMTAVFIESISCGASCVFGKRLIVPQILKELKEGEVTMFLAVPMLYNKMLAALMAGVAKQGKFKAGLVHAMMNFSGFVKKAFGVNIGKKLFGSMLLSKISLDKNRICISGGGPLPPETFSKFNQLGIDFVQGYGLTETSPITHLNPVDDYRVESIGKLLPTLEQKIIDVDEDGNGVLCIKGSVVMKGYYNNEEATKEVLSEDGWLNTGDVGHIDSDGYMYLTGRAKNIIVTEGGKNVFPEEIEDHFQLYDDIDQICIVGYTIDKKLKSEGVRALIYPNPKLEEKLSKKEIEDKMNSIVEEVNKTLQSYKKITLVTVVDEQMEMTSTKKIKRFVVQKKYSLEK